MKIQHLFFVLAIGLAVSCVPKKDLVNLQNRYNNLQSQNDLLTKKLEDCQKSKSDLTKEFEESQSKLESYKMNMIN